MGTGNQTKRLVIQIGDGADPEVFGNTCGANTFGVSLQNNLGQNVALDCDDPLDVPAAILRHLESQDTSVSIAGTVTTEAWATWRGWADSAESKNTKIVMDESAANNGGFWVVPTILETLELTKEGSGTVSFDATLTANGQRVWTDAT